MPARKSTGSGGSSDDRNKDGDAYKLKRKRNNDAVKRTREKLRDTASKRKQNVEKLKNENVALEASISITKKNVETLKDLLLKNVKDEDKEKIIEEILNAPDD